MNCKKCGKKIGPFGKVEIRDGFICRKCAKELSNIIDDKAELKKLTMEEIDQAVAEDKKKTAKVLIIIAAGIVLAIAAMGIIGHFTDGEKSDEQAQTTVQKEADATTEQTETTVEPTTEMQETETTQSSRLNDLHDSTKTGRKDYTVDKHYYIYTLAERNDENKRIFLEDAKILVAHELGCSEDKAEEMINTAIERDSKPDEPDYGNATIYYYEPNWDFTDEEEGDLVAEKPAWEEGYSYRVEIYRDLRTGDSEN